MGMPKIATTKMAASKPKPPLQPSLFVQPDAIRSELKRIKTDRLTPLEALNVLDELKKKVEKEE
jgi:DNA mismatch repair protein MutS